MTDTQTEQGPLLVHFPLTQGEAQTLNNVFGTGKWEPDTVYQWSGRDRRTITEKMEELAKKSKWPGTRSFDHAAAYQAEMLGRILRRLPV